MNIELTPNQVIVNKVLLQFAIRRTEAALNHPRFLTQDQEDLYIRNLAEMREILKILETPIAQTPIA